MTDTPPDRLSIHPHSPYYDYDVLVRGIGVRFRGEEKTTVEEYCVSEGWIKVAAGKAQGPPAATDTERPGRSLVQGRTGGLSLPSHAPAQSRTRLRLCRQFEVCFYLK